MDAFTVHPLCMVTEPNRLAGRKPKPGLQVIALNVGVNLVENLIITRGRTCTIRVPPALSSVCGSAPTLEPLQSVFFIYIYVLTYRNVFF